MRISSQFKISLVLSLVFLALVWQGFSPTASQTVLDELLFYDDQLQNGFVVNDWGNSPSANPNFTSTVYDGSFSLQKDLVILGGTGELMTIHRPSGIFTGDYTHIEFYATSLSPGGSKIRVRFAPNAWSGSDDEFPIDIPQDQWTHYLIPLADFGSAVLDRQYEGIAFSGGGPEAPLNDDDNDVAFDNIKLLKLPDTFAPELLRATAVGAKQVRAVFNEKMDATDAANVANYTISSASDSNYSTPRNPVSALLLPNEKEVELGVPVDLEDGHSYTLTVNDTYDLAGNPVPADSTVTFTFDEILITLNVNADNPIYPFNPMMRGSQLACWMHEQANKPNPNDVVNLAELTKPLDPSILRYCGGLWANNTGWDRYEQGPDHNGNWQFTDPDTGVQNPYLYTHSYKPQWIDGLASFANDVGATVLIQANICDDNPEMWADMVKYANVENDYNFRYWGLGNEIDLEAGTREKCFGNSDQTFSAQQYAKRFVEYYRAMKAVDPTIKIQGPVNAAFYNSPTWATALVNELIAEGIELDVLSWHFYQLFSWNDDPSSQVYDFGSTEALLNYDRALTSLNHPYVKGDVITDVEHWLYRSRRIFTEHMPRDARETYLLPHFPNTEIAVTEFNAHGADFDSSTNGNHFGAIWMADTLGRAAYNGQDINIWYELYDGDFNKYGLIYPDSDTYPSQLFIRPTYYSMLMYSQWFGDMLVESSTSDDKQDVVVWASKDASDPDKLKLMIVNFNNVAANVNIALQGFVSQSGEYYEMTSTDPENQAPALTREGGETSINGYTVDPTPGNVQASIDAISPRILPGASGSVVSHVLPPYSATAMILSGAPAGPDETPPVISNLSPSGVLPAGTSQATLRLSTNELATCSFDTNSGIDYAAMSGPFGVTGGISHSTVISGFEDGGAYTYYVRCQDATGNANPSDSVISFSVDIFVDDVAPTIVSASAVGLTQVSVVFSESVDDANASDSANYDISGGVSVTGASLGADLASVTLTTSSHVEGNTYTLTVNGVMDRATSPNTIAPDSQVSYTLAQPEAIILSVAGARLNVGQSIELPITLSNAPTGLAGFDLEVALVGSGVTIEAVSIEDFGLTEGEVVSPTLANLKAADTAHVIEPGAQDTLFGTVTVMAHEEGEVSVNLVVNALDDDDGFPINADVVAGSLVVTDVVYPIIPGVGVPVQDLDGDGLAEDLNGNGRVDFVDVVLLFENIDSPVIIDNAELFDFNSNGIIDMADVVRLFEMRVG